MPEPTSSLQAPLSPKSLKGPLDESEKIVRLKNIYPVLHEVLKYCNAPLDPSSEAELEVEAAKYEEERYGPGSRVFLTTKFGPRYPPPHPPPFPFLHLYPSLSLSPPAPLPETTVNLLLHTKDSLVAHISGLKQVLYLQKELGDLTLEIQNLQGVFSGAPIVNKQSEHPKTIKEVSPPVSMEKIKHKYSAKDKAHKKLAFPVLTWARSEQINYGPVSANYERVPDTSGQAKEENESSDEFEQLASDSEEEEVIKDESDYEASQPVYKKLKIKHIKELHSAVKNYGG